MDIRKEILEKLNEIVSSWEVENVPIEIEVPSNKSFGDYSTNIAMKLTKVLGKNPIDIANEVKEKIKNIENIENIEVVKPGFINFFIKQSYHLSILKNIIEQKEKFGSNDIGKGMNVIVEFSSPNIAKPFTIGHLRSTIIGDSIAKILEFSGYKVFRDNHLGDWGASFGKYLAAFDYYKDVSIDKIKKSERPIKELVNLYVRFNKNAEDNPELKELAREWFKKLEEEDPTARQLWQECIDISFIEFDKIYKKLNVEFTENNGRGYGESFFEKKMDLILEELKDANTDGKLEYRESEGAMLVFFPNNILPPLMILKSNGTTLYSTRDLATDKFRLLRKEYGHPNLIIINETGIEQSLYWKQIFKIEELLGWFKPGQRVAITHGLYRFKEGKMSTRKGNVIWLEDVLNEAVMRANDLATKKINEDWQETEIVSTVREEEHWPESKELTKASTRIINSEIIGIGAIKWNDLKRDPKQDIVFDWEEILNLKGNSSPYVLYTYVRASKIGIANNLGFTNVVVNEDESEILRELSQFEDVVMHAARNYQPSVICNYLFNLAQAYNSFYEKHSILKAESEDIRNFRIALSQATAQVLKNGLNLLGIQTVEKM